MTGEYAAFISYRHRPLDTAVATHLHRLIEHYRIPKDLRRDGEKHVGRVFRDRDELPLSSDLTAELREALDHSKFLIVICTPDTPQSIWVDREIEYFLRGHDRDNVLAVLAAGIHFPTAGVFDLADGTLLADEHYNPDAAVSPDGQTLVFPRYTSGFGDELVFQDLYGGGEKTVPLTHDAFNAGIANPEGVVFSPDGKLWAVMLAYLDPAAPQILFVGDSASGQILNRWELAAESFYGDGIHCAFTETGDLLVVDAGDRQWVSAYRPGRQEPLYHRVYEIAPETIYEQTFCTLYVDGDTVLWVYGANLVCLQADSGEVLYHTALTDEALAFLPAGGAWHTIAVPPSPDGSGPMALGDVQPWFAAVEADGTVYLYDIAGGRALQTYDLALLPEYAAQLRFLDEDRLLLARAANGTMWLLDTAAGTVLGTCRFADFLTAYPGDVAQNRMQMYAQVDAETRTLYLGDSAGLLTGLCLDMDSWQTKADIPGLMCYLPATRQVFCRDAASGLPVAYPVCTLEELAARARALLAP